MKHLGVIGRVVVASWFSVLAACAAQPASSEAQASWAPEDPVTASSAAVDDSASVAGGDVVSEAVNCSVVQYCNAPGADGARCVQQGCTLTQALAECSRETPQICGNPPTCPWIFVASNGQRFINGSCP